jgi:aldose 1-epimerase
MITKTYSFQKDGKQNDVYTLCNANGMEADILTYGGRLIRLTAPDRNGCFDDVIVGCKTPEDYYGDNPYFGATIGRYGNRIGGGQFSLNGILYEIEKNEGNNTLHGGFCGFDRVIWDAKIDGDRLLLSHLSPDGACGFPGNLSVTVAFSLSDENELKIEYTATTDKDTVCNLTNHTYFNIGGQDTVLGHTLWLNARQITPVDEELIPHGEYMDIDGTPYSFLPAKKLGQDMFSNAKLIKQCNGYDFNYCLDRVGKGLVRFGSVYDEETGRKMDCYTSLPAVQLYTACALDSFDGKKKYGKYCALCLETQGFPNAPNCPEYPSTLLKAGETYHEITAYKFSVKKL